MTQREVQKLGHGLYRLFWKSGGMSLASVGSLHDGRRWFACTNWVSKESDGIACTSWRLVDHVVLVEGYFGKK